MKKKIAMLFLLVFTLVLASCGANNSREKQIIENYSVKTTLSNEVVEKYKLDFANSEVLSTKASELGNNFSENENDYYTVYCSKDAESSLVKYSFSADEELRAHIFDGNRNKNKTFNASTLYFNQLLVTAETYCQNDADSNQWDEAKRKNELTYYKQSMVDIFLNSKVLTILYGTNGKVKDLTFTNSKFTQDTSQSFTKAHDSNFAGDALIAGNTGITFDVIYLPLYVVRKTTNELSTMVLLPIYTTFSVNGKEISSEDNKFKLVDSTVANIPTVDIVLDEETGTILR